MKAYLKGKYKLWREIVCGRRGLQNDFVGYERHIEHIKKSGVHNLPGDFLEIGAFMGGGSAKLARFASQHNKKLIVIDLFDPDFDSTQNDRGEPMNEIYRDILGQKNLRAVFDKNTKHEKNIVVLSGDSKEVKLPIDTQLCFTFIDGNHDPEYANHDFHMAWDKTVPGGIVAFHDFGGDLPQVTSQIKKIIAEHGEQISDTHVIPEHFIIFLHKK